MLSIFAIELQPSLAHCNPIPMFYLTCNLAAVARVKNRNRPMDGFQTLRIRNPASVVVSSILDF